MATDDDVLSRLTILHIRRRLAASGAVFELIEYSTMVVGSLVPVSSKIVRRGRICTSLCDIMNNCSFLADGLVPRTTHGCLRPNDNDMRVRRRYCYYNHYKL